MERLTGQSFTGAASGGGDTGDLPEAQALLLLGTALAAVNQLIVLENAAMATRAGLDLSAIEPILANGSAYSLAAQAAFAAARGEAIVDAPLLGATIEALTQLATIATRKGVPLLVTNTVRALYIEQANIFGAGAGIVAMVQAVNPPLDRDDAPGTETRALQDMAR
jgi:3-hydroxyisobutyrate dehydrogenase-like beta-hydroxyacid dehydrogenase